MATRAQKLAAAQAAADRKALARVRRQQEVSNALFTFDINGRTAAGQAGIKIPENVNFADFVADADLGVSKKQILAAIAPDTSKPNWEKNQQIALQNPLASVPSLVNKIIDNPDQAFSSAIKTSIQASGNDPQKPSAYVQAAQNSGLSANVINSATNAGNSALQTQTKALGSLTGGHGIIESNQVGYGNPIDDLREYTGLKGDPLGFEDIKKERLGELGVVLNVAAQIGLSYAIPGLGEALAAELGVSTAVGTAMVNVGVQVAQGKSFEEAVKGVGVNLLIDTGSQAVAKEFNTVINNPKITNAVVSAGASAVKTAVAGGTQEDILKSAGASLAGSGVYGLTGSKVAGAAASGAVKGGLTGAAMGAAGALGSSSTAPKTTTPTTATPPFVPEKTADASLLDSTESTSADPGIKVAGGDDASALHMAGISAMPEMLGKSNETASPLSATTDEGETFYQRTITGKTPDGKEYSYTATYDPAKNEVFYTTSGITQDEEGNVIPSGGAGASASNTRPDFSPKVETIPSLPSNVQLNDEPYDPIFSGGLPSNIPKPTKSGSSSGSGNAGVTGGSGVSGGLPSGVTGGVTGGVPSGVTGGVSGGLPSGVTGGATNGTTNGVTGEMRVDIPIDDLSGYSIIEGEEIILTYSLSYINKMCITNKLSNDIEFSLSNNCPMKISYDLGDNSLLQFFMAPKMNE